MSVTQQILSYSSQPLTHQLLLSILKDYKRPNDKVHTLLQEKVLESVKKGLYIAGPALDARRPEPFLLANHILGPSYVSSDAALFYYGLIPERVYEITSMTTKASRMFNNSMGLFSYTRLSLPYYAFGIRQMELGDEQYAMMATPGKALFDKVVTTSGLILRSRRDARDYLLENLRMDEQGLKELNVDAMMGWLEAAPKKSSLQMIIKVIKEL